MKFLKGFFIFICYTLLVLIVMGTAQKFPQWFVPYLLANYPYLFPLVILLIIGGFILASRKRFRKVFLYQLREFYKDLLFLLRETYKESWSLVPKNKLNRHVFNIGFVFVWIVAWNFILRIYFPRTTTQWPSNSDRNYFFGSTIIYYTILLAWRYLKYI